MDDSQISQIANSLEEAVIKCERHTQVTAADKPSPAWLIVSANRAGCLSLARAFLLTAIEPIDPGGFESRPVSLSTDEMQLFDCDNKRDRIFLWFQRRESWPLPKGPVEYVLREMRSKDRIALFGCAIVAIGLFLLLIGGVGFWWMMLTGEIR